MKWRSDYAEMGGYDCMTDAVYVKYNGHRVVTIDLNSFGQESCKPAPPEVMEEALALGDRIADALNRQGVSLEYFPQ